jgi:hypothetical protein
MVGCAAAAVGAGCNVAGGCVAALPQALSAAASSTIGSWRCGLNILSM